MNWTAFLPLFASITVGIIFYILAPRRSEKYCNQCKKHWGKDAPLIMMNKRGKQLNFCGPECRDLYTIAHPHE